MFKVGDRVVWAQKPELIKELFEAWGITPHKEYEVLSVDGTELIVLWMSEKHPYQKWHKTYWRLSKAYLVKKFLKKIQKNENLAP